jgi:hypothetical protein
MGHCLRLVAPLHSVPGQNRGAAWYVGQIILDTAVARVAVESLRRECCEVSWFMVMVDPWSVAMWRNGALFGGTISKVHSSNRIQTECQNRNVMDLNRPYSANPQALKHVVICGFLSFYINIF